LGEPLSPRDKPPRRLRLVALGVGAALLLLVGAALLLAPPGRDLPAAPGPEGGPARVDLHGLVVARDPAPHILRALGPEGWLVAGESLMLRARLSQPAFLALLAQRPGGAAEPIWPPVDGLHPAGEFELDEGDLPLILEPSSFGAGTALGLVACPSLLAAAARRTRAKLADPAGLARAFPGCAVAVLQVSLAAAPR
jgi:hypothetical protein